MNESRDEAETFQEGVTPVQEFTSPVVAPDPSATRHGRPMRVSHERFEQPAQGVSAEASPRPAHRNAS
jgi:hypothetical protein